MNELRDILWALIIPGHIVKLSRLIKECYLVDWKCAFDFQPRPFQFKWFYGPCGPTSKHVEDCVRHNLDLFALLEDGSPDDIVTVSVSRRDVNYSPDITNNVADAIAHVQRVAVHKDWESFMLLVSSTYPVMQSSLLDNMDLDKFAREYNEVLGRKVAEQTEFNI